jgi:hypothetical protein
MRKLVLAFLGLLRLSDATLTRIQLYPHIVEVRNNNSANASDPLDSTYGSISFGGKTFECGKTDEEDRKVHKEDIAALQKLAALEGMCFEVQRDDGKFYLLCIASGVSEFSYVGAVPGPAREVAVSKALETGRMHSWGVSEEFSGTELTLRAEYYCGDEWRVPKLTREQDNKVTVRISSFLFCEILGEGTMRQMIESVPSLQAFSQDGVWVFDFQAYSGIKQILIKRDGDDKPDETNLLGTGLIVGEYMLNREVLRSLDPEDVHLRTVVDTVFPDGDACEIYGLNRTTKVTYRCPNEWEELVVKPAPFWTEYRVPELARNKLFKAKIFSVSEPQVCVYEIVVESTAMCLDMSLVPRLFEVPSYTVRCLIK